MVQSLFLATLATGAFAGGKMALTWEDCGDASTHGHITDVQPTEIVIGGDGTITSTGTLDEELTDGSFTIQVTASLGIKETYTGSACEPKSFKLPLNLGTVSWGGLSCPVPAGPITVPAGFQISSIVPASLAKADVSASAVDQNGDKAVCVTAHLQREEEEVELQGGTLAITWEDCGDASTHAKVTDVQPTTVTIGATETIQGTGTVDEDITAVHFVATIKAAGIKIASCEGDASADIVCNMPLNAGKITVKQLPLPIAAGAITVPAEISTASVIPASLAKIDAELRATEQNGEDVVCMNIHTTKQETLV